jgi:hypothetical protein
LESAYGRFHPGGHPGSIDLHFHGQIFYSRAAGRIGQGIIEFSSPPADFLADEDPLESRYAYIRGVQTAGVAATAKHFPGFHNIALDPAIEPGAIVTEKADSFKPGFIPFADAIGNGVELIMVGPSIVEAHADIYHILPSILSSQNSLD